MKVVLVVFCAIFNFVSPQLLITNNGPCACDVTANMCNVDCCCDPNCSDSQKKTFTCSNDLISPLFYGCFPSELLFQNNSPFTNTTVGQQYCVYQDNYTLRNFYVPPTVLTATAVSEIAATNDMPTLSTVFDALTQFSSKQYVTGASIPIVVQKVSLGFLGLSRPDIKGLCTDGLAVGYLTNEQINCTRTITNLTTDCATLPTASYYYSPGMMVAGAPSVMTTPLNLSSNFSQTPSFAPVDCTACSPTCGPCSTLTVPQHNELASLCTGVITQVRYDILGETNITGVNITFTYGNVSTSFTQTFIVSFSKTGYNQSAKQRSGNPGYIEGYPMLGSSNSSTVQNVMMVSSGYCVNGTQSPILFGVNSFSDCAVQISSSNNNCPSVSGSVQDILLQYLPLYLLPYGNLSVANLVPLTYTNSSVTTSSCSSITKLTVYIVYARTGTLTLPQNTIIGYQAAFSYDNISNYANSSQYWVSVAVKFVDNSVTQFDLSGMIAKTRAMNTVRDFLYLLYVENGGRLASICSFWTAVMVLSSLFLSSVL